MKNLKNTYTQGFTLIELLVSASIIAFMSIVIAQILFMSIRVNTKTETIKEVKQNGAFALDVMRRIIQNAASIQQNCADEASGETTELHSLVVVDSFGLTTTFSCINDPDLTIARIASVSATTTFLTGTDVTLLTTDGGSNCANMPLTFTCTSYKDTPMNISIQFTLRQKDTQAGANEKGQQSFESSVLLRNTQ